MARHLKFDSSDIGFCRIYYKIGRHVYCVQEEGPGIYEFYACSSDGEPSHPVKFDGCVFDPVPEPTDYEAGFNKFLEGKNVLHKQEA